MSILPYLSLPCLSLLSISPHTVLHGSLHAVFLLKPNSIGRFLLGRVSVFLQSIDVLGHPQMRLLLLAVTCVGIPTLTQAEVYKWVDEQGKVHFGDEKPKNKTQAIEDFSTQYDNSRDFDVTVVVEKGVMAVDVKNRIIIVVKKIRSILQKEFAVDLSDFNSLTLIIYKERDSVTALFNQGRKASGDRNVPAFYRPRDNTAHVWQNRNPERMIAVISHEVTHALMRHRYKRIPTWLGEGTAEYFEQMKLSGQAIKVPISTYQIKKVKQQFESGSFIDLEQLTQLSQPVFYAKQSEGDPMYGWSGALVFYLLSSESNRDVFRRLLFHLNDEGEVSTLAKEVFERYYPGGVTFLQRDFYRWLDKEKFAHYY